MKDVVYQQKVEARDALLHCILDAVARINENPNGVMGPTCSSYTREPGCLWRRRVVILNGYCKFGSEKSI
jgi:hypothetical protein